MSNKYLAPLAAGIGGVAPVLIQLAHDLVSTAGFHGGVGFFGGLAIFFGLGASAAIFYSETNAQKAFLLGIGLPALIATGQTVRQTGESRISAVDLFPTAYAQTNMASPLSTPRTIEANPGIAEPAITNRQTRQLQQTQASPLGQAIQFKYKEPCKDCEIWFLDKNNKLIMKNMVNTESQASSPIEIPESATAFKVIDPQSSPSVVPLPRRNVQSEQAIEVEFQRKYNAWDDLQRGLGAFGKKSYVQEINIKPAP
jgi:hypothetical protein